MGGLVKEHLGLVLVLTALCWGNLLSNGDFSLWDSPIRPTGWIVEDTTRARIGQCADTSRSPAYSARITRLVTGTGNNAGLRQLVPVSGGQLYTLSAWYFDDDVNASGGVSISWRAADSSFIANRGTRYTDSAIHTWQKVSRTDTAPSNAAYADCLLRVYGFAGGPAGGVVYLDDADLSPGTGGVTEGSTHVPRGRLAALPTLVVSQTTIRYTLPSAGPVSLVIHDLTGAARRSLASAILPAGEHCVTWDGADAKGNRLPNGLYFAVLRTTAGETVRKLVLER